MYDYCRASELLSAVSKAPDNEAAIDVSQRKLVNDRRISTFSRCIDKIKQI